MSEGAAAGSASPPGRRLLGLLLLPAIWAYADLYLRVDLPGASALQHLAFRALAWGPQWLLGGEFRLRNAVVACAVFVFLGASLGRRAEPLWRVAFVGLAGAELLTVAIAALLERALAGAIAVGVVAALFVRRRVDEEELPGRPLRTRSMVSLGLLAGLAPLLYVHAIFSANSDGYRTLDWLAFLSARGLDGASVVVGVSLLLGGLAASVLVRRGGAKTLLAGALGTLLGGAALGPALDPALSPVTGLPVALAGLALLLAAPAARHAGGFDPLSWPVRLLPFALPAMLLFGHAYGVRMFRCPTVPVPGLERIADAGEVFQVAVGQDGAVLAMTVRSERRLLRVPLQPGPGQVTAVDPGDAIPAPGQEGMHPEPERPLDSFRAGETYARPENLVYAPERGVFFGTVLSADPKFYEKTISPQNDVNNMIVRLDGLARRAEAVAWESHQCWVGTLLWDAGRDRLLMGCEYEPALLVYDPEADTFAPGSEESSLGDVAAMALDTRPGGDALWAVSMWNSRLLTELGAEDFAIRRQVPIGGTHYAMEFDPRTGRLFTSEYYRSRVRVLDADTLETVDSIPTGLGTRALALDSERGLLLASSVYDGLVRVCDAEDGRERARLHVGGHVKDIALDLERGLAYFASRCGVWRLDLSAWASR